MFLLWERTKSKDRNPERKVVTLENTTWKVIYKTEMYKKHTPPVSTKNIQSHIHLNKYCQAHTMTMPHKGLQRRDKGQNWLYIQ